MLLNRYLEDKKQLQVERLELQEKRTITMVNAQFERTCEMLDFCNDEIDEVQSFRTRWAFKYFIRNIGPYAIWLAMLLIVAFGQSTNGKDF